MHNTRNNKVLITGCSTGIGLATALHLREKGFHIITSVRQKKDIEALEAQKFECIQIDLSETTQILAAKKYIKERHPDLFGIVNNGAFGQPGAVEDLSRDALRLQFETNVFGTHELTQALLPVLRTNDKGRIIHISSILGFIGAPMRGAYCASKYALEALADTQRLELFDTHIKISLIQPGPIESQFRANCLPHFQEHINIENSHYKKAYRNVERRLLRKENAKFTLPALAVAKQVEHALSSAKPKVRYTTTVPTKVMSLLKRLLSNKALDRFIQKHAN